MIIIEWIDIMLNLKVNEIIVFVFEILPKILSVFKFYESVGREKWDKMTFPIGYPKKVSLDLITMIAFIDTCTIFLLASIDIDELIVPPKRQNINGLVDRIIKKGKPRKPFQHLPSS